MGGMRRINESPSMASSDSLIPVFVVTSLGTRIALPIPPDITADVFKREFERVHKNYFPRYGSIKVIGLMVNRKSCHYYLSETLPLKYVFQNSMGTLFLHIEVCVREFDCRIDPFKCNSVEAINLSCADAVTDAVKFENFLRPQDSFLFTEEEESKGREENDEFGFQTLEPLIIVANERLDESETRAERCYNNGLDSDVTAQALNESMLESVSVSGIIKNYFSDLDEVASSLKIAWNSVQTRHRQRWNCCNDSAVLHIQICNNLAMEKPVSEASPIKCKKMKVGKRFHRHKQRRNCVKSSKYRHIQISDSMELEKTSSEVSRIKSKKLEVGKRFLVASNNLGLTSNHKRPVLSACKFSDKRSMIHKSTSTSQSFVLDMSDEDDKRLVNR